MGAGASAAVKEHAERVENLFRKIDLNNDGSLVRTELISLMKASSMPKAEECAATIEKNFDENSDGVVTKEEWISSFSKMAQEDEEKAKNQLELFESYAKLQWLNRAETLFKKIDMKTDGELLRSEILDFVKTMEVEDVEAKAADFESNLDANSDGKVTMEEWKQYFEKKYDEHCLETLDNLAYYETMATQLFTKRIEAVFEGLDINTDGSIEHSEFVATIKKCGGVGAEYAEALATEMEKNCDKNKDGMVTKVEFKEFIQSELEKSVITASNLIGFFETGLKKKEE